ncbi:MAG: hypothetical protein JNJ54_05200 [Myxococcaceae bacterium]|nr:hypothetical protein [Myxococcaceae bacterium]
MRVALVFFLAAGPTLAQVPITKQPDLAAFSEQLKAALKKAARSRDELEAMKPKPVDAKALARALLLMDFVDGCSFGSFEKRYDCPDPSLANVSITRAVEAGDLSFKLEGPPGKLALTHTNFESPPKQKTEVMKWNGEPYLRVTVFGEQEHHRVLSFDDGVLVVKVTKDGKIGSKDPKWYHQVRVAVPRMFESDGQ